MADEIDTFNKFFVASQGDDICFLAPVPRKISKQDARLLAAYLVSMADPDEIFADVLHAVQST